MDARIRLKYVNEFPDRHGQLRRYFRPPGRPAVKLPNGPLHSPEFLDAYQTELGKLSQPQAIGAGGSLPGTIKAAVAAYLDDARFAVLAKATRDMRRRELDRFCRDHGGKRIARLEPHHIAAMLSERKPFAGHNLLKTLRGLMEFCVAIGLLKTDPTALLKRSKAKAGSIHDWTEEEIAQYEARHPVGTVARLALALPLCTAQRLSDVWKMGRMHLRPGPALYVKQQKTGMELEIPIHPALEEILAATATGDLVFLVNDWGIPFASPDALSNKFRDWCDAADLPQCSMHGLRKSACRRLAEAGCTAPQIMAISGHTSLAVAQGYIRAADQKRLARQATARLIGGTLDEQDSKKSTNRLTNRPATH